ncbi:MAG TPA: hypothetical protein VFL38_02785 [Humibacillus xanthopallidus]|nr:hypothetical protein [Humibacillus xanthopallidus]
MIENRIHALFIELDQRREHLEGRNPGRLRGARQISSAVRRQRREGRAA